MDDDDRRKLMKRKNGKRILAAVLGALLTVNGAGTGIFPDTNPGTVYGYNERQATVKATSLNVRSGPGTGNSVVKKLDYGAAVTVVDETKASDGVTWYKIRFASGAQTLNGYVSAEYIKFPVTYTTDSNFESYMSSQGFPESYKESLRTLHAEFPSWQFQAQHTGLDWNDVIANEGSVGANLVDKDSISSWKSTEYGAYDWNTGKWPGFDGATWVAASREIVSYYMDPRNFLNETYVFQFLLHSFDSNNQTKEGLQSLVKGTFLEKTAPSSGQEAPNGSGGFDSGDSNANSGGPGENYGPGFGGAQPGNSSLESQGTLPVTEVPQNTETTQNTGNIQSPGTNQSTGTDQNQGNVSLEGPSATVSERRVNVVASPSVEYGPGMDASAITGDNTGASTTSPVPAGSSYVDIIMEAASQSGVNPYVIGAMIIQEQGQGKSGSISGTTSGYEGYYNFFNIGAYQSGSMSAITRGLWYASQTGSYGRPWNSIDKSIIGGAQYYGDNYVKQGQDTFYLKKFNVQGNNLYKHQYMTNIEGAAGEGAKLSRAYTAEMKKQTLVFKIPVYKNMPETACVKPTKTGSPNNKLSGLDVTGYALTPTFSMDTESYDIIVNPSVDKIAVNASAIDSTATVTGTGTVSLQSGNNTIRVEVKAQNGDIRNYQLNVVRQSDAPVVNVPDSGSSSSGNGNSGNSGGSGGVTIGPGQTGGPGAGGTTSTAAQPAETSAPASETSTDPGTGGNSSGVQVGVAPDGSNWGTGTAQTTAASPENGPVSMPQTAPAETSASAQAPVETAPPAATQAPVETTPAATAAPETGNSQPGSQNVRKGDVNGDGTLSVLDVMLIKKHILGETVLNGAYAEAADVNGDGVVNEKDVSALQNMILAK